MIKVKNLIKTYGNFTALDKVNFEVEKSTIHGLLGENGAGKTTTMRCLLGLTYADSGEMYINDDLVARKNNYIRKKVSYLAGDFRPYENFTAQNYFKYILSIENNTSKKYLELAERFKLNLRKKIKELSKGNKQKVGIIQAFMKDPQILILDEPTSGLDPNYQKVFRDLIFEEKSEGKTILLSSHDLLEISNCCDFVTIIRDGKVIASQSKSEIEKKSLRIIKVKFNVPPSIQKLDGLDFIKSFESNDDQISFMISNDVNSFIKFISDYEIIDMESENSNLSDTLMEYF
ncbi:MAG: ABC transporter ATP-binding protein [SAR202 cluster bacterium]|nr:ABC transporter ATP-binding protein [Chloroflexota bacterium]MEC9107819.1 ABC transporter ATP-binding protein [Chloroflexota bacterium]MQG20125.1 ABC transporter ATP-binding protein [SAR202 cluster bacterium]MQG24153.1 ABC transporter ATP-binding protein [SAR202 cluster bacterium]MQG42996.1 ABC transporter ATP-binding protein [SAR202 cluster bacterium]|tara:strand:+ start:239 stop:1105 length:867 start_codon:yes stop_codon:yes gene_type:complete